MLLTATLAALLAEPLPLPSSPVPMISAPAARYATLLDVVAVPKQDDFTALYPIAEPGLPDSSAVSLNCAVQPDGVLVDCEVFQRGIVEARFTEATKAITAFYRLRPLSPAEVKAWPADVERRFRTSITWSRSGSGITRVPTLPLPPPTYPADGKPELLNAEWIRRPGPEEMSRYYPSAALAGNLNGRSVILCGVTGEGLLERCVVESETPPDMGFGKAAVQSTRLFRMRPLDAYGGPVEGGKVRIPFSWFLPE